MMWGAFFKLTGFGSGPLSLVAWRSSPVALLAAVPMCLWQICGKKARENRTTSSSSFTLIQRKLVVWKRYSSFFVLLENKVVLDIHVKIQGCVPLTHRCTSYTRCASLHPQLTKTVLQGLE